MNILLVGTGRIGIPLHDACTANGHRVVAINSKGRPATFCKSDYDLVILAVAPEDSSEYTSFGKLRKALSWVTRLQSTTPVASVSSLTPHQLEQVSMGRPHVRFMCSSAISTYSSLRFYDETGTEAAIAVLEETIPGDWLAVSREQFSLYTHLLVVTALNCAFIENVSRTLELTDKQQSFLTKTLTEAHAMIKANGDSPQAALESALTPGGVTATLLEDDLFSEIALAIRENLS